MSTFRRLSQWPLQVAYLILVGNTFTRVAAAAFGDESIFADRHVIVLTVSVIFILPLSLARNISSLSHFSMLGLASVAVIIMYRITSLHH